MKKEVMIRLRGTQFPGRAFDGKAPVFVGVQREEEVEQAVGGDSEEATFDFPVTVAPARDGTPNFTGPYVFGKSGDRFLYLVWFVRHPGFVERFRRAKIKLGHLSWEHITAAIETGRTLEAVVSLTDVRGGPVCATLKANSIRWAYETAR